MIDKYRPPMERDEDLIAKLLQGFKPKPGLRQAYQPGDDTLSTFPLPALTQKLAPARPNRDGQTQPAFDVENSPVFAGLDSFHQKGAARAAMVLNISGSFGYVDLVAAKRMVDFGAGSGGPTLALSELAKINGGTVDAIESRPHLAKDITDLGILSASHVLVGDGIELLRNTSEGYDLITAFMLGPDDEAGTLTRELLAAGQEALNPGGHVLITSDVNTMRAVQQVCQQEAIPYDYIQGVPIGDDILPSTVIASFPPK